MFPVNETISLFQNNLFRQRYLAFFEVYTEHTIETLFKRVNRVEQYGSFL